MKLFHVPSRSHGQHASHPDGVRYNSRGQVQGIFGLAPPPHDPISLRCRPTREEVAHFQDLPEERQIEALNTYLRMIEEFTRWDRPAAERFVLTLQNGSLKFVNVPSKSVGSEPQISRARVNLCSNLIKNISLKSFQAVLSFSKSIANRHRKDGI